jgi:hypothetical protein
MQRHKPVRWWLRPWTRREARADPVPDDRTRLSWNDRTMAYPAVRPAVPRNERPLMTRGQEWRSRIQRIPTINS